MKRSVLAVLVGCLVSLTGCPSKPPVAQPQQPQFAPPVISAQTAQAAATQSVKPEAAVEGFLTAIKTGNSEMVAALLSETARNENARHGMVFSPESIPDSKFKVDPAVYPPEDPGVAHVNSSWSDGKDESAIIWVLRQEPAGWRVAGAAMQLDISEDPVFINFEEPAEIQQVQQAREAAAQAAQTATQSPAQGAPAATTPAGTTATDGSAPPAQSAPLEAANQPAKNPSETESNPIRTATPPLTPLRK